jgi:hypothetical protein
VYDPATGMFMNPDPYIQAPKDWLNYNRYSYCMGNPFKFTDPSGKFFKELFSAIFFILSAPFSVITMGIDLLSGKTLDYAWNNSPLVAVWNAGKAFDQAIFGKSNPNQDVTAGQPGASGAEYITSDGDKYYKFNDLKSMVNFMYHTTNDDNTLNPFHYEMVGYALDNGDGTTSYYVLDWSGNTNEKSHNFFKTVIGMNTFDGKGILAEFHTHPASYYSEKNRSNAYDGSSYEDYLLAKKLRVPVYSIGPHSVSVIKPSEDDRSENYFKQLGSLDYKSNNNTSSGSSLNFGGNNEFTNFSKSEMRSINPYCIAETSTWLENPQP